MGSTTVQGRPVSRLPSQTTASGGGEEERGESDGPPGTGRGLLDGAGEHPAEAVPDHVEDPEDEPLPEGAGGTECRWRVRGRLHETRSIPSEARTIGKMGRGD